MIRLEDFTADALLPLSDHLLVLAGHTGASIHEWKASILRIEDDDRRTSWMDDGWFVALSVKHETVWAVHGRLGDAADGANTFTLLVSHDGGQTFSAGGTIPSSSVTGLAYEGDDCGTAIGVNTLLRTDDAGASWRSVQPAGRRSGASDPLAATSVGRLMLGGEALLQSADAGLSWTELYRGRITACDGVYFVEGDGNNLRIGRVDEGRVTFLGHHERPLIATKVHHVGDRVLICCVPTGKRAGLGAHILKSRDGGRTFSEQRLRNVSTASVGFTPSGQLRYLDRNRRLRR